MLLQPYLSYTHTYTAYIIRMQTQHQWGSQIGQSSMWSWTFRTAELIQGGQYQQYLCQNSTTTTISEYLIGSTQFPKIKTMKDDEDDIINLIFYCVGCNIVDILGMVGELPPSAPMVDLILSSCHMLNFWAICFLAMSALLRPCAFVILPRKHCPLSRKHWGALHPLDTRPAQAQDWLPQVSVLLVLIACTRVGKRAAFSLY